MTETIITNETLYEILRREKTREELQILEKTFFQDIQKYLYEKTNILKTQKEKSSIFSRETEKTSKQIDNVKRLLKEIYERREAKIIQMAIYTSRTNANIELTALLPEELEFYNTILNQLKNSRDLILNSLMNNQKPEPKSIKRDNNGLKPVRFTSYIPSFVDQDSNTYGPYEPEDIASLPERVSNLLIEQEKAKSL
ncbi:MAG: hypothetical protein KJ674_00850 [Nanoarchaeota archaeon]|nr:hypothetical protein [Nanoarchaeota archaeon]